MATKRQMAAIIERLRGLSLTHEQAAEIRMHLVACAATQSSRSQDASKRQEVPPPPPTSTTFEIVTST